MTFAFIALAVGVFAFAVSVLVDSRPVALFSGVAAVGLLLSAAYPTGVSPASDTIHSVVSTAATVSLTAAAAIASLWRLPGQHRTLSPRLPAVGAVAVLLVSPWLHNSAYRGLGQRVLWLLLVASIAAAVARGSPAAQAREPRAAQHSKIIE